MSGPEFEPGDDLLESIRRRIARYREWQRKGEPSASRQFARIGVLGWIVVAPLLLALVLGRWLDHLAGGGIFWSAALLLVGAVLGLWSAWQWMHEP